MNLLFLSKRRPQGRDLYERPYGRFYYLPKLLAERGHNVTLHLASYKADEAIHHYHDNMEWVSTSAARDFGIGYVKKTAELIRAGKPDYIVGLSDIYYGILADIMGSKFNIPTAIDAYDNYESYIAWAKPLHFLWRRALRRADTVTAAGPNLAALLGRNRPGGAAVIPMCADPCFHPMDKVACRSALKLPHDRMLIGYCGSIFPNRGIEILFEAMTRLQRTYPGAQLVLSGRLHPSIRLPSDSLYLGYLPDAEVPGLLNSLDVLTVINQNSAFGNHSYPVKLYEALACKVPVVATRTPASEWILNSSAELLVEPGDAGELAEKIVLQLRSKNKNPAAVESTQPKEWGASASLYEQLLLREANFSL
jgi:glycosyltransferase involved in cell wall biosynthesis